MAIRNISALPSDYDLDRIGIRSVSRFVSLWKPRTVDQRLGGDTDFVTRRVTFADGSVGVVRSIYTSEDRQPLR